MTYEYVADTEVYKGYTIKIVPDEDGPNPCKDYDMFGKMVCWHNRYNLGHEQPSETPTEFLRSLAIEHSPDLGDTIEYWENDGYDKVLSNLKKAPEPGKNLYQKAGEITEEYIEKAVNKVLDKYVVTLPLYLYDHSGITMRTSAFSCPWDSGQVGFIYATREMILKEYGGKVLTKAKRKKAIDLMVVEVETYDQYLTGDIYGYEISKGDEDDDDYDDMTIESCWGFYGMKYCMEEAKSSVDYMVKQPQFEI